MGLKLGIYADFGTRTCAGYPGSLDHLQIDAEVTKCTFVTYIYYAGGICTCNL